MKLNKVIEEKRKQREKAKKMEQTKNFALGTAIGTALGAAAGLLFAPKSGKETRGDITTKSKEVADTVKTSATDQYESTKQWSVKVKDDIKKGIDDINFKKAKDQVEDAVEDVVDEIEIALGQEDDVEGIATVEEIVNEDKNDKTDKLTN